MGVMRQDDFQRLSGIGIPLSKVFFLEYGASPPEYSGWINIKETDKAIEEDLRMAEFGPVPELTDGDVPLFQSAVEGEVYRYRPVLFSLGYVVTQVALEDDQYGILGVKMTRALRKSFRHRFELESYKILNNATSTSAARFKGFDTLALLSTAHTALGTGVTDQANKPTTDLDLSSTAVEAAVRSFHGWKGEQGLPMFSVPSLAIVSGDDQHKAARVFKNAMQWDTANNEENWVKQGADGNGISRYIASRYFTDADAWFILANKDGHDLNLKVRINPQFQTNTDFATGNFQAKGRARLVSGYGYWYGVYGSTGG